MTDFGASLSWREWLALYAPGAIVSPFSEHQVRVWEWFEALTPGVKPPALIECWSRGHGKSTTVELATARLVCRGLRKFVLYVSCTQEAANWHVGSIAAVLERAGVERAVTRYGHSRGWNQSVLRASNGCSVLAFGLDAGARGVKLDEDRPAVICLDDVDELGDSVGAAQKRAEVISQTVLRTGSVDCAVCFIQNKIHPYSVMNRTLSGELPILLNRVDAPVIPAVEGLVTESVRDGNDRPRFRITGGRATWDGMPLSVCEQFINESGLVAFLRECQHEVNAGGQFFSDWSEGRHTCFIQDVPRQPHWQWVGGLDWGYGAPFSFHLATVDEQGRVYVVDEVYRDRQRDDDQARLVKECLERNGAPLSTFIWADPQMWARESDHSGRLVAHVEAYHAAGLNVVKAAKDPTARYANIRRYLGNGLFKAVKGRCPNLIRTIPLMVFDPNNVERLDTDGEDHAVDSIGYLLGARPAEAVRPKEAVDDLSALIQRQRWFGPNQERMTL